MSAMSQTEKTQGLMKFFLEESEIRRKKGQEGKRKKAGAEDRLGKQTAIHVTPSGHLTAQACFYCRGLFVLYESIVYTSIDCEV